MKLLRVGGMAILLVAAIVLGKAWLMPGATSLAGQSSAVGTEHPENEAIRARLAKQNEMLERMAQFEHAAMSASSRRAASQDGDGPGGHDRAAENTSRLTPEQLREQMSAQRAEAREQGLRQFASLGSGWAGQPVDPGWSDRHEADIRTALAAPEFESVSLTDVDCRSSICKLEISGSSEIDIESFNLSLAKLGPFQDTEYTTGRADEGDPNRIVLYLARPGGDGLAQFASNP